MTATLKIDSSGYEAAVKQFLTVSSRSLPEVLNRSAKSVSIKAYQWTPSASRTKMQAYFFDRRIAVKGKQPKVVAMTADIGKMKARKKVRQLKWKKTAVYSKIIVGAIAKKTGLTGPELYKAVAAYVGKATAAASYIRHGWTTAIMAFGGKAPSSRFMQTHPYGGFRKAYPGDKVVAMVENAAEGADKVGAQALQIALDQEAQQLREEIKRRMTGAAKAASGKRK